MPEQLMVGALLPFGYCKGQLNRMAFADEIRSSWRG